MTKRKYANPKTCKHPPTRYYSWFARGLRPNKKTGDLEYYDVLCVVCCDCGKVLKGGC